MKKIILSIATVLMIAALAACNGITHDDYNRGVTEYYRLVSELDRLMGEIDDVIQELAAMRAEIHVAPVSTEVPEGFDIAPRSDFSYSFSSAHGGMMINTYSGDSQNPAIIESVPVTAIGNGAFRNANITSVHIPETVVHIGSDAFNGSGLESITLPPRLQTVGNNAFANTSITSFNIPGSMSEISAGFRNLQYLETVIVDYGVRRVAEGAFMSSPALYRVVLPESVTEIGVQAFQQATNLRYINIPHGVSEIAHSTFLQTSNLHEITIPETVTVIRFSAFHRSGLYEVIIPETVEEVGDNAFSHMPNLRSFSILGAGTNIAPGAFADNIALETATLPEGMTVLPARLFSNAQMLSDISLPGSLVEIGVQAFEGAGSLTGIVLPYGLERIEGMAFSRSGLTEIIIPASVTFIGNSAFGANADLTRIYFEGDAPETSGQVFWNHHPGLVIVHYADAEGFTNPWNGVPTMTRER